MRLHSIVGVIVLTLVAAAQTAFGQYPAVELTGPLVEQLSEGRTYDIEWQGFEIDRISIIVKGELLRLPGSPDLPFIHNIIENLPANSGRFQWTVPFLDALRFQIEITAYDSEGGYLAADSREYVFRPEVLRTRIADGIYVDLRNPEHQRLYRLENNIVTHAYLTSGARTHYFLPRTADSSSPHDHVGAFRLLQKYPMYWSNEYEVWMTHAMRYWKGHFIHGTYPNQYFLLGHPASSGCVRLHRKDAEELYGLTTLNTRVEIFGGAS